MNRYLVVDDDEMSRLLLANFLSEFAPCDVAAGGREGLEMFEQAFEAGMPYSLLCVDLLMPEINGHLLIKKVREAERTNPVISDFRTKIFVISSSDSPWDKAETLLEEQCDDYIVKPFNRAHLMENLYRHDLIFNNPSFN